MTATPPLNLAPRGSRVVLFFAAFFGVIVGPQAVLWGLVLLGPPPYLFDPSGFEPRWLGERGLPDGATLSVTRFESEGEARAGLARVDAGIRVNSRQIVRDGRLYTRSGTDRAGVLMVFDRVLVQVEAPDADAVERAIAALPFMRRNPSPAAHVMDSVIEHWRVSLAGLGVYLVLALAFMGRGGAWAARLLPPAGAVPIAGDALRRHLLAVNDLDVPFRIREARGGYLVAEWRIADARWTSVLEKGGLTVAHSVKMKLDERNHVVRTIDVAKSLRWTAGFASAAWSFSFFRGISFGGFEAAAEYGLLHTPGGWVVGPAYRYAYTLNELKQPLVKAVVANGWTWQPVITFFRPIGG